MNSSERPPWTAARTFGAGLIILVFALAKYIENPIPDTMGIITLTGLSAIVLLFAWWKLKQERTVTDSGKRIMNSAGSH